MSYCVKALVQKGLLKVDNFRAAGNKLRYMYILTPTGFAEKAVLTGQFLKRKMVEYEALKAEIEAVEMEMREPNRTNAPSQVPSERVGDQNQQ